MNINNQHKVNFNSGRFLLNIISYKGKFYGEFCDSNIIPMESLGTTLPIPEKPEGSTIEEVFEKVREYVRENYNEECEIKPILKNAL